MVKAEKERILLAVTLTAVCSTAARGYQINPLSDKYRAGHNVPAPLNNITDPVHEEITYAAARCAASRIASGPSQDITPCEVPAERVPLTPRGNKYDPLIRGLWWNDDPNQNLFAFHYATWALWMNDAHGIATNKRNWLGRRSEISERYKIQYRSHYGDLQFLHSMANADGDSAVEVQSRILDWMEFAYTVAIGKVEPDTAMHDVNLALTRRFFARQPGWTVNHLFAPKYTLGKRTIRDVALGSMLHVIQDSFSKAHVHRAFDGTSTCPSGRVVQFHSYGRQDPKRHGEADTRQAWLADDRFTPELSPVEASARMIRFARERADWATAVLPYLRTTLFCLDSDAEPSGPGNYLADGEDGRY